MRGLFVKDFCLLKQQMRSFVLLILVGVLLSMSMQNPNVVMGYLILVAPIYAIGTISYDEFDHGNPFLFTLPFVRSDYVIEKYLLGIGLGAAAGLLGIVLTVILGTQTLAESVLSALGMLLAAILVIAVMLPLTLRFGAEKAKIIRVIVLSIAFFTFFSAIKILE